MSHLGELWYQILRPDSIFSPRPGALTLTEINFPYEAESVQDLPRETRLIFFCFATICKRIRKGENGGNCQMRVFDLAQEWHLQTQTNSFDEFLASVAEWVILPCDILSIK